VLAFSLFCSRSRTPLEAGPAGAPPKHLCLSRRRRRRRRRGSSIFSLLILNISFRSSLLPPASTPFGSAAINASRGCFARTTADDLFPLFDKYGKVVDLFIPRDWRYVFFLFSVEFLCCRVLMWPRGTGESRGFAFVRYKYADEAQKAVDKLDGRVVDGREIGVQFAKYGPNVERINKGRIAELVSKIRRQSRSRSPRPRYRDEYRDRDCRRNCSRSREQYDHDRYRDR
ncbi:serine/arginine-rich splicing factor SC35-like, partial [Eucalyptus grandis]|uniref:serine/arginine-rich splicing factor SC35-like n=1 Tax=Eucalyptus grandis TaxID=71139 RepID=UPI00192EAC89